MCCLRKVDDDYVEEKNLRTVALYHDTTIRKTLGWTGHYSNPVSHFFHLVGGSIYKKPYL
jgi:hypothetical protein